MSSHHPFKVRQRAAKSVLCVGYSETLLEERADYLQGVGYHVETALGFDHATSLIGTRHFDAVVFGHLVPAEDRNVLLQKARRTNPRVLIVLLYWGSVHEAQAADALLFVGDGPAALAEWLQRLLDY